MKIRKVSCVPLAFALILSLSAVWAGAAPVLGNGASVLGGVWYKQDAGGVWRWACTATSCSFSCPGTVWETCESGNAGCSGGGYIEVASDGAGDGQIQVSGQEVCIGACFYRMLDTSCIF